MTDFLHDFGVVVYTKYTKDLEDVLQELSQLCFGETWKPSGSKHSKQFDNIFSTIIFRRSQTL